MKVNFITVQLLEPGHVEEDLSNHNVFGKQNILNFFCTRTNKIHGSTQQPLKTLKWNPLGN